MCVWGGGHVSHSAGLVGTRLIAMSFWMQQPCVVERLLPSFRLLFSYYLFFCKSLRSSGWKEIWLPRFWLSVSGSPVLCILVSCCWLFIARPLHWAVSCLGAEIFSYWLAGEGLEGLHWVWAGEGGEPSLPWMGQVHSSPGSSFYSSKQGFM